MPFTSREDVDFFLHLEMHLRQDHPPLAGRDHLAYRGSFVPVKDTIDGDLCEQFSQARADPPCRGVSPCNSGLSAAVCLQLPVDKQRGIAEQLDRTPARCSRSWRTCATSCSSPAAAANSELP